MPLLRSAAGTRGDDRTRLGVLEPDMAPLAHLVPAEYRWIETSDGRVAVYGVRPPDPFQRCRIEHRLACPEQTLPDL
ncbi:DUF6083 domain-containing protein [Streptomyces sp. NPDC004324]